MGIEIKTYQDLPPEKRAKVGRNKILELLRNASLSPEERDAKVLKIKKWISGEL